MRFLILWILPLSILAGFSDLETGDRYQYGVRKKSSSHKKRENPLQKILEEDLKILELLKKAEDNTHFKKREEKIVALTRLKGIILNSVLAMNIKSSKFIVRMKGHPQLESGELRCTGIGFEKRVLSQCDLLVLEGVEYKVNVHLWDLDGAEGLIADYFYSGEEKSFLTSSFASFWEAILQKNKESNEVFKGVLGIAQNAGEKLRESGEKKLTIAYVNSGKEVIVFFNESLILKPKEDQ